MKNPDGYWNAFLSSMHFMTDHEVSWCTLKNHERSWWLLKQLWCITNYYDLSRTPMGKSLRISWSIMKKHDQSWFATLHFREAAPCSLLIFSLSPCSFFNIFTCPLLLLPVILLPNDVQSPCPFLKSLQSPCSLLIFLHSPCSLITPWWASVLSTWV